MSKNDFNSRGTHNTRFFVMWAVEYVVTSLNTIKQNIFNQAESSLSPTRMKSRSRNMRILKIVFTICNSAVCRVAIAILYFSSVPVSSIARDITFCDERIPVEHNFVAKQLMNVISSQIPSVNMIQLRQQKMDYFPVIEDYLRQFGLPQDLKYIPIIESGFNNLSSSVGARGFWQLMPGTARQYGLKIAEDGYGYDERDDIHKATRAACRKLIDDYNEIVRRFNLSSWVLTVAGYNWGNGNIQNKMRREGTNYFAMNLNKETAVYVYKIIAVKELFEYPELYMKGLGGNVFSTVSTSGKSKAAKPGLQKEDTTVFRSMTLTIKDEVKNASDPKNNEKAPLINEIFILGKLKGNYNKFRDGDVIAVELKADLKTPYGFAAAGQVIKGSGWIIDGRIFVGFEDYGHCIIVDNSGKKGIAPQMLKSDKLVTVRYEEEVN
jgi:membrane-bound lytic murein transglycosylase D